MTTILALLAEIQATQKPVSLVRGVGLETIHGFVVRASEEVTLISVVDDDGRLDGLTALRTADIIRVAVDVNERFRALVQPPSIDLGDAAVHGMGAALETLLMKHGRSSVWMEQADGGFVVAESAVSVSEAGAVVIIQGSDGPATAWFNLRVVTRIDAGGRYEKGLDAGGE